MNTNLEQMIDTVLERIAEGYRRAKAEWQCDKRNTFKDGRFLAYYEAATEIRDAEDVACIRRVLQRLFERAKAEWLADRQNTFKDGRFLACFEMLNMVPCA